MSTKEYLRQALCLDKRIDAKLEQVERLKSLRERVTTVISDMPKGKGGSDRVAEITSRIWDLENQINEDIDRFIDIKTNIRQIIANVKDERYRMVLEYRYLNGHTWEKIAEEMNYEVRHVYWLHGFALKAI